jgi:hypothetical protein
MCKIKKIYVEIKTEHLDEIINGCMGLGPYSTMPYASIDKNKYKFVKLIKTIYKDMRNKTDADIIGWDCELELI